MRRLTAALMAAMLVMGTLAAIPAITMAQDTTTPDGETTTATPGAETEPDKNETSDNGTDPGAQLAGVVGVSEAELDGELQSRTFGIKIANAASDGAKAGVVADQLNDSEERIEELQERKETLQEARKNGSIGEGEYRARIARLHAETRNVQRLTNGANETASVLPAETLEERGINATRITMLSERANELSGPEVAEIARGIAGQNAGGEARPEQARDRGGADGSEDAPDRGGQDNETDTTGDDKEAATNGTADGTATPIDGDSTDGEQSTTVSDTSGTDTSGSDGSDASSTNDTSGSNGNDASNSGRDSGQ